MSESFPEKFFDPSVTEVRSGWLSGISNAREPHSPPSGNVVRFPSGQYITMADYEWQTLYLRIIAGLKAL